MFTSQNILRNGLFGDVVKHCYVIKDDGHESYKIRLYSPHPFKNWTILSNVRVLDTIQPSRMFTLNAYYMISEKQENDKWYVDVYCKGIYELDSNMITYDKNGLQFIYEFQNKISKNTITGEWHIINTKQLNENNIKIKVLSLNL